MDGVSFPNQAILWHQNYRMSSNLTQFWHPLPTPQVKGSVPQDCLPTSTTMPITNPGCHLCFWPVDCRSEFPTTPSSSLINLLEQLTELRETVYLLDYQFIIKGYNTGTAKRERFIRQGMWEGAWSFHALSGCTSLPAPPYIHQPGSFWTPSFRVFKEASIHRHDWLNPWPLLINLSSSPCPFPIGGLRVERRGGWNSNPQITGLVPLATSPILININSGAVERGLLWITRHSPLSLELFQELELFEDKRPNIITKDSPIIFYHLGNYKGFRSYVPGTGLKTKYIFLIVNHSITVVLQIWGRCDWSWSGSLLYVSQLPGWLGAGLRYPPGMTVSAPL